jgi:uncharacterized membrane protein HdeD (DUF308 family)
MNFYDNDQDYREQFRSFWNDNVKKFRTRSIIVGIILIILGVLCIVYPVDSLLVIEIIASIAMICAGVYEIVLYTKMPIYFRMGGGIVSGILNILLGILLLTSSKEAMFVTFAFIFSIEMLVVGIEEIAVYRRARFFGAEGAGWLLASGIINVVFAIVLAILPQMSVAIGILLAIYLLAGGIMLVLNGINAKDLKAE